MKLDLGYVMLCIVLYPQFFLVNVVYVLFA